MVGGTTVEEDFVMRRLVLERREVDPQWLKKPTIARPEHGPQIIESDTEAYDAKGNHLFSFVDVDRVPSAPLLRAVETLRYDDNYRTKGLRSNSRVFGFQPRIPIRRDYCAVAALAYSQPEQHATLIRYGKASAEMYERLQPQMFREQVDTLAKRVLPHWREEGVHFTSGIANKWNTLHYHRDAGNIPEMSSTMLSIVRDMPREAGMLVLPEYGVSLAFCGFQMLLFRGAEIVHGVTPISRTGPTSCRYTIVYYPLVGMCSCMSPAEELARVRRRKTEQVRSRTTENMPKTKQKLLDTVKMSEEQVHELGKRREKFIKRKRFKGDT